MSTILSIQPGQDGHGMHYNPKIRLPYPFHIDAETGKCVRGQGVTTTFAWTLLGFTNARDLETIVLTREDWVKDPSMAVGRHAVFQTGSGITSLRVPIIWVNVHELEDLEVPA